MKCKKCGSDFPNRVLIDGKSRTLHRRKFCVKCSPFGKHNTSDNPIRLGMEYRCKCGETDPTKFYPKRKYLCARCHVLQCTELGRRTRDKALELLGGRCVLCGFKKYLSSLDIHHLDPSKKDPAFRWMRSWSWERLKRELVGCVLLCKNCHAALHNGLVKIGD